MLDAAVTFRDGIGVDDLTWLAELIAVVTTIVAAVWAMLRPVRAGFGCAGIVGRQHGGPLQRHGRGAARLGRRH